jgi:hypothetical protein
VHHRDERRARVDRVSGGRVERARPRVDADPRDHGEPVRSSHAHGRAVAGCSMTVVTTWRRSLARSATPRIARLFASVPPDVNTISSGVAAEERGDLLARAIDGASRARAVDVPARRVAEVLAQVRQHRVDDLGQERRRRVVIEVDGVAPRPRR